MSYKILHTLSFFSLIILLLTNCQKEKILETTDINISENSIEELSVVSGILKFNSEAQMNEQANKLNSMGIEEIKAWNQEIGFRSQELIYIEINEAEDIFDNEYYAGLDPDISLEEMRELGFDIKHSELYNKYLNKGFIKEQIEDDGSSSFEVTVINPSLMNVLSADGYVIVGNDLYQFTSTSLKILPNINCKNLPDELTVINAANEGQYAEFKFKNEEGLKGYLTYENKHDVFERGSKLRLKRTWRLRDCSSQSYNGNWFSPSDGVTLTHFIELDAEEKRFGKWKSRSSYTPIKSVSANWETCIKFYKEYNPNVYKCDWNQSGAGVTASPLTGYSNISTNYFKTSLSPVGYISASAYAGSGYKYDGIVSGNIDLDVYVSGYTGDNDPNVDYSF